MLIVGAGPVGLATAISAARAGLNVTVIDKREPPIDKACGEGVMPGGIQALHAMGVEIPSTDRHPFVGIRYIDGALVAEGRFLGATGWGIRRTVLQNALLNRARRLGVTLHFGCALRRWEESDPWVIASTDAGVIRARTLVAADGLHSRIRDELGVDGRPAQGVRRFGVRQHVRIKPWASFVEVYWSPTCEAYVTPVGPEEVGVAILCRGEGASYDTLLKNFPALISRIEGAEPVSEPRGAGPLYQPVKRRYRGRVALVGDAAGYVDALTGEGLTLGFRCGEALARTVARNHPLAMYERAYRQLSRAYYRDTRLLLQVAKSPALRHTFIRLLTLWPGLFNWLLTNHASGALEGPLHSPPLRQEPRFGRLNLP